MRTKETSPQMLTMTDLKQYLKQILFRTQNTIKKNKPKLSSQNSEWPFNVEST